MSNDVMSARMYILIVYNNKEISLVLVVTSALKMKRLGALRRVFFPSFVTDMA